MKRYTKKQAGALGGACSINGVSAAKRRASIENGKKGGRPRRITVITSHAVTPAQRITGAHDINILPTLRGSKGYIAGYIIRAEDAATPQ